MTSQTWTWNVTSVRPFLERSIWRLLAMYDIIYSSFKNPYLGSYCIHVTQNFSTQFTHTKTVMLRSLNATYFLLGGIPAMSIFWPKITSSINPKGFTALKQKQILLPLRAKRCQLQLPTWVTARWQDALEEAHNSFGGLSIRNKTMVSGYAAAATALLALSGVNSFGKSIFSSICWVHLGAFARLLYLLWWMW